MRAVAGQAADRPAFLLWIVDYDDSEKASTLIIGINENFFYLVQENG